MNMEPFEWFRPDENFEFEFTYKKFSLKNLTENPNFPPNFTKCFNMDSSIKNILNSSY